MLRPAGAATAALLIACMVRFAAAEDLARLPVPHSAEQSKAEHMIRLKYKAAYAGKFPSDRLALARTLRKEIDQFADDPAARFVMLREARELALDGGSLDESFAAIDDLDREFNIDARQMRFSVMTSAIDKSGLPPAELIDNYLKIADRSIDTGDIDFANKSMSLADMLATQSRDAALKERVAQETRILADARREQTAIKADIGKLRARPEDEALNFEVGKYVCFRLAQWKPGVFYLSRGSDPKLKDLATQEMAAAKDPQALAAVADLWSNYSNPAIAASSEKAKKHAADLYRRALPDLPADKKAAAQQKLDSITPPKSR